MYPLYGDRLAHRTSSRKGSRARPVLVGAVRRQNRFWRASLRLDEGLYQPSFICRGIIQKYLAVVYVGPLPAVLRGAIAW